MSALTEPRDSGLVAAEVTRRTSPPGWTLVLPSLKDPRCTLALALTLWTVLGQTAYYFNRNLSQLGIALLTACILDFVITALVKREISLPLSAYITALSVGLLLESYDW